MGKRSTFERREKDFYPTPFKAVLPLVEHVRGLTFCEPCAGEGDLFEHLLNFDVIGIELSDIEVRKDGYGIALRDVFDITATKADCFITNPPWPQGHRGQPTVSIIEHLSTIAPTWLLLSSDFSHNAYFGRISDRCRKIVSVGRVKWIADSKYTGKENCAWYLFDKPSDQRPVFYGRSSHE